jgi:hypothetical protein
MLTVSNLKILVYSVDPDVGFWIVVPRYPFMDLASSNIRLSQSSHSDSRPRLTLGVTTTVTLFILAYVCRYVTRTSSFTIFVGGFICQEYQ